MAELDLNDLLPPSESPTPSSVPPPSLSLDELLPEEEPSDPSLSLFSPEILGRSVANALGGPSVAQGMPALSQEQLDAIQGQAQDLASGTAKVGGSIAGSLAIPGAALSGGVIRGATGLAARALGGALGEQGGKFVTEQAGLEEPSDANLEQKVDEVLFDTVVGAATEASLGLSGIAIKKVKDVLVKRFPSSAVRRAAQEKGLLGVQLGFDDRNDFMRKQTSRLARGEDTFVAVNPARGIDPSQPNVISALKENTDDAISSLVRERDEIIARATDAAKNLPPTEVVGLTTFDDLLDSSKLRQLVKETAEDAGMNASGKSFSELVDEFATLENVRSEEIATRIEQLVDLKRQFGEVPLFPEEVSGKLSGVYRKLRRAGRFDEPGRNTFVNKSELIKSAEEIGVLDDFAGALRGSLDSSVGKINRIDPSVDPAGKGIREIGRQINDLIPYSEAMEFFNDMTRISAAQTSAASAKESVESIGLGRQVANRVLQGGERAQRLMSAPAQREEAVDTLQALINARGPAVLDDVVMDGLGGLTDLVTSAAPTAGRVAAQLNTEPVSDFSESELGFGVDDIPSIPGVAAQALQAEPVDPLEGFAPPPDVLQQALEPIDEPPPPPPSVTGLPSEERLEGDFIRIADPADRQQLVDDLFRDSRMSNRQKSFLVRQLNGDRKIPIEAIEEIDRPRRTRSRTARPKSTRVKMLAQRRNTNELAKQGQLTTAVNDRRDSSNRY